MGPYYDRAAAVRFGERHPPRSLAVGGRDWSYLRGGTGKTPVLFLHGLGDAYDAGNLVLGLEDELNFLAPFLPPVASLEEMAAGVEAILDREGVDQAVVAGISFGALLAQAFFHRRPHRVAHLFLADAFGPDRRQGLRNQRNLWVWDVAPLPILQAMVRLRLRFLVKAPGPLDAGQEAALDYLKDRLELTVQRLDRATAISQAALGSEAFLKDPIEPGPRGPFAGRILSVAPDDLAGLHAGQATLHRVFPTAEKVPLHGAGYLGTVLRPESYREALRRLL